MKQVKTINSIQILAILVNDYNFHFNLYVLKESFFIDLFDEYHDDDHHVILFEVILRELLFIIDVNHLLLNLYHLCYLGEDMHHLHCKRNFFIIKIIYGDLHHDDHNCHWIMDEVYFINYSNLDHGYDHF
jgi:hypothetical protein